MRGVHRDQRRRIAGLALGRITIIQIVLMKTNFFSTVPQAFCTLLACGALTVRLAAATADGKSADKSSADTNTTLVSAERVALAAVQAHLEDKPLRRMADCADDTN